MKANLKALKQTFGNLDDQRKSLVEGLEVIYSVKDMRVIYVEDKLRTNRVGVKEWATSLEEIYWRQKSKVLFGHQEF